MAVARVGWDGTNGNAWPGWQWTTAFLGGTGTIDVQSNRGRILTSAVGGYVDNAAVLLGKPVGNADVVVRVTPGQAWNTNSFFGFTFGDALPAVAGYDFIINQDTLIVDIAYANGATITSGSYTFTASIPVWVRYRRQGTFLGLKIWDDGTPEPPAWTLTATDAVYAGTVLYPMFSVNTAAAAVAMRFDVDQMSIDDFKPATPILLATALAGGVSATSANAGSAAGTGQAFNASVTIAQSAGAATGTGAAGAPTANPRPNAGNAAGTGSAKTPSETVAQSSGVASGTGAASSATTIIAGNATSASGTGVAGGPTSSVKPNAGAASGTGSAFNATVSTAATANASAGNAAGTGTAYNATVTVAQSAGAASGTGTAFGSSSTVKPNAGNAAGTGQAMTPSQAAAVAAGAAAGVVAAFNALLQIAAMASAATGVGTAYNPTFDAGAHPGYVTVADRSAGVTLTDKSAGVALTDRAAAAVLTDR